MKATINETKAIIVGLNVDPRRWTREDAMRVRDYCQATGLDKTEILPPIPGKNESATWARIEENGKLVVWFFSGMCKTEYTINFV